MRDRRSTEHRPRARRRTSAIAMLCDALEPRRLLAAAPLVPVGTQPAGALTGRIVYTSGGHGWAWSSGTTWSTGRGNTNGVVEDFGNQDQMSFYAEYLLKAGATVVPMRPVGHQLNEVVVDNIDATFTGSWADGTSTPYYSTNGGTGVKYKSATTATTETAVARFTPDLPEGGFYPVYAWALDGGNRATDQTYRVNYSGGSIEVKVNHTWVGKGWVYLGTYYFDAGTGGNVEVSNKSAVAGKAVIADAIRFGNGMGDYDANGAAAGGTSGKPREDEASLYWVYGSRGYTSPGNLVSASLFTGGSSTDTDKNVGAPSRMAAYMNAAPFGQALFLSFHTNASGGRGTLGLHNTDPDGSGPTPHQFDWANIVGTEVVNDMVGIGAPPLEAAWVYDPTPTLDRSDIDFGEISSPATGDEFDATILEVAYHDDATDAALLKDPKVRAWVAQSSVQATVKYFNQLGGLANSTQAPASPTNVRATTDAQGNVTVAWTASATGASTGGTGAATAYRVYASANGYGFDGGTLVSAAGTSLTIAGLPTDAPTFFRVAAVNAGGESMPSEVVAAHPQAGGYRARVLIVDNFRRLDRFGDEAQPYSGGTTSRVRLRYNNTRDYVVRAADAITGNLPAVGYETAGDVAIALGLVNLANYQTVIWLSGEQSTADVTFTATVQPLVASFVSAGGKLFVSGSEVGYDLVVGNHGSSFLTNTLRASYLADDANTYTASGAGGSIFSGIAVTFDNGTQGTYDVDYADKIGPAAGSGAVSAMSYTGSGSGSAGIQWAQTGGNGRVVMLGFPFETITTPAARNAVMGAVLNYFGTASVLSAPSAPGVPDLLASSDTGISDTDNLTKLNNTAGKTLQFDVPGTVAGALVSLYADGTLIGTGTGNGGTITVTTNAGFTLTDGVRSITARQSANGSPESADSGALAVTVDATAPALTSAPIASPRTSAVSTVTFPFSEAVYGFTLGDVTLLRDGANALLGAETVTGSDSLYNLTGTGPATTRAGTYEANFDPAGITDAAGNTAVPAPARNWKMTLVSGTAGNDTISVGRAGPASNLLTVHRATPTGTDDYTIDTQYGGAAFPSLTLRPQGGVNSVTLDFSNGGLLLQSLLVDGAGTANTLNVVGTAGNDAATFRGDGTVTINGYNFSLGSPNVFTLAFGGGAGADSISIPDGTFRIVSDVAPSGQSVALTVGNTANVTLNSTQHLSSLQITGTGVLTVQSGGNKLLSVRSLSVAPTAKLNLTDNDLIWLYAGNLAASDLKQLIAPSYGGGKWDGAGLGSSTAADPNNRPRTALAYADNAVLGYTLFGGEPVNGNALLTKYTWYGDANLSGKVSADDISLMLAEQAQGHTGWTAGDFNFDDRISSDDWALLNYAIATQDQVL